MIPEDNGLESPVMQELHRRHAGRLDGRVVAVTGASRGLGAAIAVGAAGAGADVVLLARSADGLAAVADVCARLGRRVLTVSTDVTSYPSVVAAVGRIDATFGRLDGWVNNAGVCMEVWRRDHIAAGGVAFEDLTVDGWHQVVDVNLNGPFHCLHAALPLLLRSGVGSVVNVLTSPAGFDKPRYAPYGVTKGALHHLTQSLATELAGRLRVNDLCPGGCTWSEMIGPDVFPDGLDVLQTTVVVPGAVHLLAGTDTGTFIVGREWNPQHGFPVEAAPHHRA